VDEAFIFCLILYQALLASTPPSSSSPPPTFSKVANLPVILTWYYSLTSTSFTFLRLYLSISNFCASHLLTVSAKLFQPRDNDQYYNQLLRKLLSFIMIILVVCFSMKRSPSVFVDVTMRENFLLWQSGFLMWHLLF